MSETAVIWWKEVRERLEHTARNLPDGFERQTVFNLLADQDALQLVCQPYSDLELAGAVRTGHDKAAFDRGHGNRNRLPP
jgi:hypothetical protein